MPMLAAPTPASMAYLFSLTKPALQNIISDYQVSNETNDSQVPDSASSPRPRHQLFLLRNLFPILVPRARSPRKGQACARVHVCSWRPCCSKHQACRQDRRCFSQGGYPPSAGPGPQGSRSLTRSAPGPYSSRDGTRGTASSSPDRSPPGQSHHRGLGFQMLPI